MFCQFSAKIFVQKWRINKIKRQKEWVGNDVVDRNLRKNRLSRIPHDSNQLEHLEKLDLWVRTDLSIIVRKYFQKIESDLNSCFRWIQSDCRHSISWSLSQFDIVLAETDGYFKGSNWEIVCGNRHNCLFHILFFRDLASNSISDIGSDLFSSFSTLVSLKLARNHIANLKSFSFSRLRKLETM